MCRYKASRSINIALELPNITNANLPTNRCTDLGARLFFGLDCCQSFGLGFCSGNALCLCFLGSDPFLFGLDSCQAFCCGLCLGFRFLGS